MLTSFPLTMLSLALPALAFSAPRVSGADTLVSNVRQLEDALKELKPGDTVIMKDGEWPDTEIRLRGEGTPDQPITLRAQTIGGAKLTGQSWIRMFGRHLIVKGLTFERGYSEDTDVIQFREDSDEPADHCRVTRCSILAFNPPAGSDFTCRWVRMDGVSNRLDHCYFAGKANHGATVVIELREQANHHRIDHNHFGPRPPLGGNGGETIRVGDSDTSLQDSCTIVEDNLFEQCDGEVEIISVKSCRNVFRRNTFKRCSGTLTLRHGNNNRVEANWFLGEGKPDTGGVRVLGEGHRVLNNYFARLAGDDLRAAICVMAGDKNARKAGYAPVRDAVLAFNTFIECEQPLVIGVRYRKATVSPSQVQILGNLIVNRRANATLMLDGAGEGLRVDDNVFSGKVHLAARSGFRKEQIQLVDWKGVAVRPRRPHPIGIAQDKLVVTSDIEDEPRTRPYHAGCDQVSEHQGDNRPLSPSDVGPAADRDG